MPFAQLKEKTMEATQAKFSMGLVFATPGALAAFEEADESSLVFLMRHASGDWGDVCSEDRQANEFALENKLRLFSVYHLEDGTKIWIITEAERSVTTILLPSEY
jgi:hypothetical protein